MAHIDIGQLRKRLGISQAELGKRLGGLDQATISRWETGKGEPEGPAAILLQQLVDADDDADRGPTSRLERPLAPTQA